MVAFVELCDTQAGVWGSPFGSVAAAKIWSAAPRRRAHASELRRRARKRLRDSFGAAAAASARFGLG